MRIEILYFEDCPGFAKTLSVLEEVIAEKNLSAELLPVMLGPDERCGFPGSPTILVDGKDLFPTKRHSARSCRIYLTPEGPKNYPTAALVRAALAKR